MASRGVNKVILVGNLGKDPETKYMPSGDCVCNLSMATTESWKDKSSGEKVEKTEWHRVVMFVGWPRLPVSTSARVRRFISKAS